jgi:hypothetical protein
MRGPLGNRKPGDSTSTRTLVLLASVAACSGAHWPASPLPPVPAGATRGAIVGALVDWSTGKALDGEAARIVVQARSSATAILPDTLRPRPDGSFALSSLQPGEYRIAARAIGYLSLDTLCHVEAGQVDTLVLMLDAALAGEIRARPLQDRYAKVRPGVGQC